jgi:hypothetical protein
MSWKSARALGRATSRGGRHGRRRRGARSSFVLADTPSSNATRVRSRAQVCGEAGATDAKTMMSKPDTRHHRNARRGGSYSSPRQRVSRAENRDYERCARRCFLVASSLARSASKHFCERTKRTFSRLAGLRRVGSRRRRPGIDATPSRLCPAQHHLARLRSVFTHDEVSFQMSGARPRRVFAPLPFPPLLRSEV